MRAGWLLGLFAAGVAVGCGAHPPTPRASPASPAGAQMLGGGPEGLAAFGAAYRGFQDARGRPPATAQELAAFGLDTSRPLGPAAMGFSVAWGAGMGPLHRDGDAASTVLASAPPGPDGVPVLFADGTTRTLTADEFRAAKRAAAPPP